MTEAGKAEAGREASIWCWRNAVGIACVAVLHLGALYALLTTEYGAFAITLALLAWLFANCLVLVFLPRPGIAAALSLMATVVLIAFSRFKFDILQLSITFLDFLIIDRDTFSFLLSVFPRLKLPLLCAAIAAVPALWLVWRTDPFRHETSQMQPGVSSYCFDRSGYGALEWRRGRTACRTRAQARFDGPTLRLRDADTTCNDGSHWYADQLVCQRGADNVAQCSGNSRGGVLGPVSWTVNLHKLN